MNKVIGAQDDGYVPTLAPTNFAMAESVPMSFDFAEDLPRFVFATQLVFDEGMPAYSNAFVTQV